MWIKCVDYTKYRLHEARAPSTTKEKAITVCSKPDFLIHFRIVDIQRNELKLKRIIPINVNKIVNW